MAEKSTIMLPKRGEVYLVNFDPTIGSEIRKTRPALIVQNDIGNEFSPITIVAAITAQYDDNLYPTEVSIEPPEGGLSKNSIVLLNQIRSVDKKRLIKRLGKLTPTSMKQVERAIQISFGLIKL